MESFSVSQRLLVLVPKSILSWFLQLSFSFVQKGVRILGFPSFLADKRMMLSTLFWAIAALGLVHCQQVPAPQPNYAADFLSEITQPANPGNPQVYPYTKANIQAVWAHWINNNWVQVSCPVSKGGPLTARTATDFSTFRFPCDIDFPASTKSIQDISKFFSTIYRVGYLGARGNQHQVHINLGDYRIDFQIRPTGPNPRGGRHQLWIVFPPPYDTLSYKAGFARLDRAIRNLPLAGRNADKPVRVPPSVAQGQLAQVAVNSLHTMYTQSTQNIFRWTGNLQNAWVPAINVLTIVWTAEGIIPQNPSLQRILAFATLVRNRYAAGQSLTSDDLRYAKSLSGRIPNVQDYFMAEMQNYFQTTPQPYFNQFLDDSITSFRLPFMGKEGLNQQRIHMLNFMLPSPPTPGVVPLTLPQLLAAAGQVPNFAPRGLSWDYDVPIRNMFLAHAKVLRLTQSRLERQARTSKRLQRKLLNRKGRV